ncbi:peptidylprolyl isomerase [Lautropia mirabilis]|jgi:PPIC-type PPIASE domain protein|uniref:peptidylprolyl isomerase n=1 Tax=Lautropia mirabilis TaxID=47671 RepID=UPI00288AC2CB|nr:peptidylprolyl isomerase [Lautropia mirabilis]
MNAIPHFPRLLLAAALALSAGGVQAAQTTSSRPVEKAEPAAIQPGTDVPPPQPISDEVIGQEYDAYRQSVKGQKMYTVSYILLSDEAEARQWIARLRSGASFEKAAREHSKHPLSAREGGKLGTFATCRWAKDTVQMLDTLKPGQIHAKPVKASAGWGIYRLDAVKPLEPISYAQYKEQLLSGTFKPECPWVPPVTVGVPREP